MRDSGNPELIWDWATAEEEATWYSLSQVCTFLADAQREWYLRHGTVLLYSDVGGIIPWALLAP